MGGRRLFAFLGSTIGNFDSSGRRQFLREFVVSMTCSDRLLLGTYLRKDSARLVAAYDDTAGVTAAFNRNVLRVLNAELGADFVPERFGHLARWNAVDGCIEIWLRAQQKEQVSISALNFTVNLAKSEELLTEISTKFSPEQVRSELTITLLRSTARGPMTRATSC
jgi:L-histidine N-alpha-methyltransferase